MNALRLGPLFLLTMTLAAAPMPSSAPGREESAHLRAGTSGPLRESMPVRGVHVSRMDRCQVIHDAFVRAG